MFVAERLRLLPVVEKTVLGAEQQVRPSVAVQVIAFAEKYGMTGSTISISDILHLKSGGSYLENNTMVAVADFLEMEEFRKFDILVVDEDESYAANSLWVNGKVLVAKGFPETAEKIANAGYPLIELDVSEFRKLDGGLSCLSLRF